MAMTNAQKNAVSEMQVMAAILVVARTKATLLSEIYPSCFNGNDRSGEHR